MTFRAVILCCHLLFTLPLFARENTDVIVMRNGDRFTGQIKGLESGVLYVGLSYVVQTLSVDWSQVARVESKQHFLVKTEDGSVYRGVLNSMRAPGGQPVEIRIAETPEASVVLKRDQIVTVSVTSERFLQRFTGGLGLGTIYTKGNQSVQYSISGLAAYPRERWAVQTGIKASLSSASGTKTSTYNQLTLSGGHLLPSNNYFVGGFGGLLQSSVQGIAHQTALGGGIGRYLVNSNFATIAVLGGIAWQNTSYNSATFPIANQNVGGAMINTDAKLFKFNKTNLDLHAMLLPALSEPGRVYFSTNASYNVNLFWNLAWNFSFYGNWDNRPPGNLPGSDYGTTSGLSWTFGSSLRTAPMTVR